MNSPDDTSNYAIPTKRLERAIKLANGEFSLVIACCDSVQTQEQIVNLLRESLSIDIQEIILSPETRTLYSNVVNKLGQTQPLALVIRGLESVQDINQLLISTNMMRDGFRQYFHCPVILWVNEEILTKLIWLAPDFKNWAASTIKFEVPQIEQAVLSA
jgi:hypothetical protein